MQVFTFQSCTVVAFIGGDLSNREACDSTWLWMVSEVGTHHGVLVALREEVLGAQVSREK